MPLLPLLSLGAGLLNQGLNAFSVGSSNRQNRKFAGDMYNRQRADALKDFDMQNEYNSPTSQMARLKAAGLNPNLVYGSGAATQASAAIRQSSAPNGNAQPANFDLQSLVPAMFQLLLTQARTNNINADTENKQTLTKLGQSKIYGQDLQNHFLDNSMSSRLEGIQIKNQLGQSQVNKVDADTAFTIAQNIRNSMMTGQNIAESIQRVKQMVQNMDLMYTKKQEILSRIDNLQQTKELLKYENSLHDIFLNGGDPGKIGTTILQSILKYFTK